MSLFQSIGEAVEGIRERLDEWDEAIREKTDEKLNLGMVTAGILLLLIVLASAVFLLKPSGVTLYIADENGNPIDGALVRLYDENGNLVASARSVNGTVQFDGIPNKKYTFIVSKDGFEDFRGDYDPDQPGSASIRLKPAKPGQPSGGSGGLRPPGTQPPVLPPTPVLLPGGPGGKPGGGEPTVQPPAYLPDAELTVVVRDKQGGQPVSNAVVTIRDSATNAFLVQGPTNAQGVVKSGLRQGSSVVVSAFASGYAAPQPKSVAISAAQNTVELLLASVASGQALRTNVTVLDANRTPLSEARVQIYAQNPVLDQLTGADGRISPLLEKDQAYTVRASKPGFRDAFQSLQAGQSVELLLNVTDSSILSASLLAAIVEADGTASAGALTGIYKQIGSDWVPFISLTANAQGVVQIDGLEAGWAMRVNATSPRGMPSGTNETILTPGANAMLIRFPSDVRTQVSPTPTPVPTPTTCRDGTICPGGTECVQSGSAGVYLCRSTPTPVVTNTPTPGVTLTPTPSPQITPTPTVTPPVTVTEYTVCRRSADGRTSLDLNGFTYALKDLNGVEQATFEVSNGSLLICAAYTPRCTYVLGTSSAANDELADITNVKVIVASINPRTSCAELSVSSACTGGRCTQVVQCPATYAPVCGSNGITYANDCHATNAGITTYVKGTCGVQCTDQYDPVCSTAGVEYPNSCIANREGVSYNSGRCPVPPNGLGIDVPAGWSIVAPVSRGALLATDCTARYHYVFKGYAPSSGTYFPVRPSQDATVSMEYQSGYYAYSDRSCRIYWQPGEVPQYYSRTLSVGWQLIGAPSTAKTPRQILGNCRNVLFFSHWGTSDSEAERAPVSLDAALQPGHGYWVNYDGAAGTSCTLTDEPANPDPVVVDYATCTEHQALAGTLFSCPADQVSIGVSDKVAPLGVFETYTCCNLKSGTTRITSSACTERASDSSSRTAACTADEFLAGVRYDSTGRSITAARCCALAAAGRTVVRQVVNGAIPNYAMTFRDGQAVQCPGDKIMVDVGDTVTNDGNADSFNCRGAMLAPKSGPSIPGPVALVCKRTATGTCAPSGSYPGQTCGTTCPGGFSPGSGSCVSSGLSGDYGLFSCTGSAQCLSDESYPALGQCNVGDVPVESSPSESAYFYTCKRKLIGSCAPGGSYPQTCGMSCPAGFSGAPGSCTVTGQVGDYGISACGGSAECLSNTAYSTLSGCKSGDVQLSSVPAAGYTMCRRKAVGSCSPDATYQACANTCPSGFTAAPNSCQSSGESTGGYGVIAGCSGTAECWSSDYYLAAGDCNAGDVKVQASVAGQIYAQCKRKTTASCGLANQFSGTCSGGKCPVGYSTSQTCEAPRVYGGYGQKFQPYCNVKSTAMSNLECISDSTYLRLGGCDAGDVQVGSTLGN